MRQGLVFKTVLLLIALASPAHADLLLTGSSRGGVPGSGATAVAGSTVQLDLFLTQTGSFGFGPEFRLQAPSSLVGTPANELSLGFGGGHVQISLDDSGDVTFSGGESGNTVPAISFVDGVAPNISDNPERGGLTFQQETLLSFDAFSRRDGDPNQINALFVANSRPPASSQTEGTISENSILIGTFSVDVSPNAIGDFVIALDAPFLGSGTNTLNPFFGQDLDSTYQPSSGSIVLSVSAIPEPSSVACLLVAGVAGLVRRRRR